MHVERRFERGICRSNSLSSPHVARESAGAHANVLFATLHKMGVGAVRQACVGCHSALPASPPGHHVCVSTVEMQYPLGCRCHLRHALSSATTHNKRAPKYLIFLREGFLRETKQPVNLAATTPHA